MKAFIIALIYLNIVAAMFGVVVMACEFVQADWFALTKSAVGTGVNVVAIALMIDHLRHPIFRRK